MGLLLTLAAGRALGHLPLLRGHLVELVQSSELIIIGTVTSVHEPRTDAIDTTVRVEQVLAGQLTAKTLTFHGAVRFAPNERYGFFLRREATDWQCLQQSGVIFPAPPADDAIYSAVIGGIRTALHAEEASRIARLQAALLPALSASAAPWRYEAALDLDALSGPVHPLEAGARQAVIQLLSNPASDPALRPLLLPLVLPAPLKKLD